jgi:integrase
LLAEAVRWGVIATNPALAIRPPRAPRPDLHVPDAETCAAILERARGWEVEGAVVIALGTGMRLGEILALRWKDVDLERKTLRVTATLSVAGGAFGFPAPKTSRARRSVDLPPFVVAFLRRQRKAQTEQKMRVRGRVGGLRRRPLGSDRAAARAVDGLRRLPPTRPRSRTSRGRGSTICATRTRRSSSRAAFTRRP